MEFRKAVLFDLGSYLNDPVKLRKVIERLQKRKKNVWRADDNQ